MAGLDPTTFNKSKRGGPGDRLRWPSTESIAKVLDATGASIDEFMALITGSRTAPAPSIPLVGLAKAGQGGFFDDGGYPAGTGFDEITFPDPAEERLYGLRVSGDSMLPLYRNGDVIVVSPAASIRRGDRVVVRTREGEVMAKELKRRAADHVELRSLNPEHPDRTLALADIDWMARIMWARQ